MPCCPSSDERELFGDSSSWRQFVIWNHPEVLAHNILAALVLGLAGMGLSKCILNQRVTVPNGSEHALGADARKIRATRAEALGNAVVGLNRRGRRFESETF